MRENARGRERDSRGWRETRREWGTEREKMMMYRSGWCRGGVGCVVGVVPGGVD